MRWLTGAVLVAWASVASADPMSNADLVRLIEMANHDELGEVVIPPGEYRIAPRAEHAHLEFTGLENLVIRGEGATFLFTDVERRGLQLNRCRGVEIVGLTLDYAPLPFTQGTVRSVDRETGRVIVSIDAGYATDVEMMSTSPYLAPFRDRGNPQPGWRGALPRPLVPNGIEELVSIRAVGPDAPRELELELDPGVESPIAERDRLVIHFGWGSAVDLMECHSVTLRDMRIWSAPDLGVIDAGGGTSLRLLGVRIEPGPPPARGVPGRLISTSKGGVMSTAPGSTIALCRIHRTPGHAVTIMKGDAPAAGRPPTVITKNVIRGHHGVGVFASILDWSITVVDNTIEEVNDAVWGVTTVDASANTDAGRSVVASNALHSFAPEVIRFGGPAEILLFDNTLATDAASGPIILLESAPNATATGNGPARQRGEPVTIQRRGQPRPTR